MNEILKRLPPGAYILDLGCSAGSFEAASVLGVTVRVDLEARAESRPENFVQADAARLPFRSSTFDLVAANHSLEHFEDLEGALREIGRVAKSEGVFAATVPDATTVTDRIYRWLARGGGHVNSFESAEELAQAIERHTSLTHAGTRTLYSSLSFLNRKNAPRPLPKRLLFLFGGLEPALVVLNALFRILDRFAGTRTSIYGWALYFGHVPEAVDSRPWTNVCVRCGQGHPSDWLAGIGVVRRRWWGLRSYKCPNCGAANFHTRDESYAVRP